jgi:hypothetical protein
MSGFMGRFLGEELEGVRVGELVGWRVGVFVGRGFFNDFSVGATLAVARW